ncbi:MAG TPA: hypothetical protein VH054_21710 [Polyangiaceae bacterium]|nr:hypothetical protein [Polyangiaceae bacterium]
MQPCVSHVAESGNSSSATTLNPRPTSFSSSRIRVACHSADAVHITTDS